MLISFISVFILSSLATAQSLIEWEKTANGYAKTNIVGSGSVSLEPGTATESVRFFYKKLASKGPSFNVILSNAEEGTGDVIQTGFKAFDQQCSCFQLNVKRLIEKIGQNAYDSKTFSLELQTEDGRVSLQSGTFGLKGVEKYLKKLSSSSSTSKTSTAKTTTAHSTTGTTTVLTSTSSTSMVTTTTSSSSSSVSETLSTSTNGTATTSEVFTTPALNGTFNETDNGDDPSGNAESTQSLGLFGTVLLGLIQVYFVNKLF